MSPYIAILGLGALLFSGAARKPPLKVTSKGSKTVKASAKVTPSRHYASVDGKRILILGDSLSMLPNTPGGHLARRLADSGAIVEVNAIGGRYAGSFLKGTNCDNGGPGGAKRCDPGPGADQLATTIAGFDPDVAIIMLGTNDLCNVSAGGSEKSQLDAMSKIIKQLGEAGVKVVGVGPPAFPSEDQPHKFKKGKPPRVYATGDLIATGKTFIPKLEKRYTDKGFHFIDSRLLTVDLSTMAYRPDGIHFRKGGDTWAERLAEEVAKAL